ncbi:MAG: hypothetical protein L6Q84_17340 [Polyangiaceae bacterium]|nr:hypothetical protein [Polyangiaceae bacterium]
MLDWYRRYRKWAHASADQRANVVLAAGAGALGAGLLSASRIFGWRWQPMLAWLCVVGGPIAALDALGAARYRGQPAEGWARFGVILVLSAIGAWVGFAAR